MFGPGDRVRLRSGGPEMTVTRATVDGSDGAVTVWVTLNVLGEMQTSYYPDFVLTHAADEVPAAPASVRPEGPRRGDVVENPRCGGLMTVCAVDQEEEGGAPRVWAQWFLADEYGSGSFPLDASGRVTDYEEPVS